MEEKERTKLEVKKRNEKVINKWNKSNEKVRDEKKMIRKR